MTSDAQRAVLTGAKVVLPTGVADGGRVTVEHGRIVTGRPEEAATWDLTGHWIVPGFVDMHVHGGGGASFSAGTVEQARTVIAMHRAHGTTTMAASTVTGELGDLAQQAGTLSELVEDGELAGIHFEGPFIAQNRCGAHQPSLLREPDPATVRKLVDAARGTAVMLTLAPELPGGLDSVRLLREHGVPAAAWR
jgi:N-acetylglucosamine-6-phosphate deacetylase